jgi:hypothetical protein
VRDSGAAPAQSPHSDVNLDQVRRRKAAPGAMEASRGERFATLDFLYKACGVLAAIALAGIAVLILAQIVGRFFGLLVPSANEIAGFLMAASSFLALGYAFRSGSHIRVTMLLSRLPVRARRALELEQRVRELECLLPR